MYCLIVVYRLSMCSPLMWLFICCSDDRLAVCWLSSHCLYIGYTLCVHCLSVDCILSFRSLSIEFALFVRCLLIVIRLSMCCLLVFSCLSFAWYIVLAWFACLVVVNIKSRLLFLCVLPISDVSCHGSHAMQHSYHSVWLVVGGLPVSGRWICLLRFKLGHKPLFTAIS